MTVRGAYTEHQQEKSKIITLDSTLAMHCTTCMEHVNQPNTLELYD